MDRVESAFTDVELPLNHPALACIGPLINHPESARAFYALYAYVGLIAYMVEQFTESLPSDDRTRFSIALRDLRQLESMCGAVSASARELMLANAGPDDAVSSAPPVMASDAKGATILDSISRHLLSRFAINLRRPWRQLH